MRGRGLKHWLEEEQSELRRGGGRSGETRPGLRRPGVPLRPPAPRPAAGGPDALFFLLCVSTAEEWQHEASPELKNLLPPPRDAVAYILDQFPIVRRKDEERFGEYRTKRVILEIYDAMQEAMRTGRPWASAIS